MTAVDLQPVGTRPTGGAGPATTELRLAYTMSRFPRLSETFVLFEMVAMEPHVARIDLYPLIRERSPIAHDEAMRWDALATYERAISWRVLRSNLWFLRHRARRYVSTLASVVRGTRRSRNFLFGGLAAFPKTVHYARTMERRGTSHLHCHFATHPALAGYVVNRLTGIPFSFTAHGSDLHVDRTMLGEKVERAAFVVAISEFNRRIVVDEVGPHAADKVHVVHCGVDTAVFEPVDRARSADEELRIVCVGTLHEVKGQRHLLGACARLRDRGVAFHCTFVGDGEDRAALEALRDELGLAEVVTFRGGLTRDGVAEELRRSHVLAAPSVPTAGGKREGIPVVLMEAMASGLPVVSSRLSGIPELVTDEHSGLLTEPGDVDGIAAALGRLAASPELCDRLAAAGRATVASQFDVRTNAALLLSHVQRAAGERRVGA